MRDCVAARWTVGAVGAGGGNGAVTAGVEPAAPTPCRAGPSAAATCESTQRRRPAGLAPRPADGQRPAWAHRSSEPIPVCPTCGSLLTRAPTASHPDPTVHVLRPYRTTTSSTAVAGSATLLVCAALWPPAGSS